MHAGEPIHGEIHSADASAGVQIVIYNQGSVTARTLNTHEYIEIHSLELVTAAGGDCYVFLAPTAAPVTGKYVVRGTFAANGGIAMSTILASGQKGDLPWVIAPAGAVDVIFKGVVRKAETDANGGRAAYQASLVPGR